MAHKPKAERPAKGSPKVPAREVRHYRDIWTAALHDLRGQIEHDCLTAGPDKLRFQDGRLFENLKQKIVATEGEQCLETAFICYWLITDDTLPVYQEPQRLHLEEINARKEELSGSSADPMILLSSIASWIEAQESLSIWLMFNHNRTAWQNSDPAARMRALEAGVVANFPKYAIEKNVAGKYRVHHLSIWLTDKWTPSQWASILDQAARLARKPESISKEERWVWWCYPIFRRFNWSAREVQAVAASRGFKTKSQRAPEDFRRDWITRGLRFSGTRTSRSVPPLAELVRTLKVPDETEFGVPVWY